MNDESPGKNAQRRVIAILARAPQPGRVKTRMQPQLSAEQCIELHLALTEQVVANASAAEGCEVQLWCDGPSADIEALARQYNCKLKRQSDGDLGMRMAAIACECLRDFDALILVGADCPFVTAAHFERLFERLSSGVDAVITPAPDGGYVALALTRPASSLFLHKAWGGENVAAATIKDLEKLGWRFEVAPELPDIDRAEDLILLNALPGLAAFARLVE